MPGVIAAPDLGTNGSQDLKYIDAQNHVWWLGAYGRANKNFVPGTPALGVFDVIDPVDPNKSGYRDSTDCSGTQYTPIAFFPPPGFVFNRLPGPVPTVIPSMGVGAVRTISRSSTRPAPASRWALRARTCTSSRPRRSPRSTR